MSTYILYSTELYHHGIKGQKWGRRRFQNKDGSLTPAGKERYDDDGPKKSKHRLKLEEKYKAKGMNQAQAEEAASKRIKMEKIIGITAGVTVAAVSAYAISKRVSESTDRILKSGTTLQRVSRDPNEDLDRAFYAAHKKGDKVKYKGLYGNHIKQTGNQAYEMKLQADKDVKVVSRDKAASVFADLYKNDPEFQAAFKRSNKLMGTGDTIAKRKRVHDIAGAAMTDKQLKRQGYDAFNIGLVNHDEDGQKIAKKFYSKLKSMGYDAVEDVNDKKFSGYGAKNPVIVFNKRDKLSLAEAKKMTDEELLSNAKKVYGGMLVSELAKKGGVAVIGAAAVKKLTSVANRSGLIAEYKRTHPNTEMTDAQIYETLTKKGAKK